MSGWVSSTHPAPSPIPLGALRGGYGVGRSAGRMGARLPTEWVVLCGGVDLEAVTEGLQMDGARLCWSEFWTHRIASPVTYASAFATRHGSSVARRAPHIGPRRCWSDLDPA